MLSKLITNEKSFLVEPGPQHRSLRATEPWAWGTPLGIFPPSKSFLKIMSCFLNWLYVVCQFPLYSLLLILLLPSCYKLSSQVLGSLLAGFWLLLLLLNPRPTSGWKQTNKYQHGSCVLLVHCFFFIMLISPLQAWFWRLGELGVQVERSCLGGKSSCSQVCFFIYNLVFLVFVLIRPCPCK